MATKKKASGMGESIHGGQLENEIRGTAQKLYEERCRQKTDGGEVSDWLTAEAFVKLKHTR